MSEVDAIVKKVRNGLKHIPNLTIEEQVAAINAIKEELHKISPFKDPVDLIRWIPADKVEANDYNPNSVAPPEMKLLEHSIREDGYTMSIVAYHDPENDRYVVVDGFHRNRVGKEVKDINERVHNHLPLTVIDKSYAERMASTIRHNRARGTHGITPMSKIVEELYFLGWSDKKIAQELGMEKDEVLRLKQFTGLGVLFEDRKYSRAWV